jgi:hypothetical protein
LTQDKDSFSSLSSSLNSLFSSLNSCPFVLHIQISHIFLLLSSPLFPVPFSCKN